MRLYQPGHFFSPSLPPSLPSIQWLRHYNYIIALFSIQLSFHILRSFKHSVQEISLRSCLCESSVPPLPLNSSTLTFQISSRLPSCLHDARRHPGLSLTPLFRKAQWKCDICRAEPPAGRGCRKKNRWNALILTKARMLSISSFAFHSVQ